MRRHAAPDLALWLPAELTPTRRAPFGLYLHPDAHFADRMHLAALFRRAIGIGAPRPMRAAAPADRPAAMLCLYDLWQGGASLGDMAAVLLDTLPATWRESSGRSDLRRLLDAGTEMVAGGYRRLLGSRPAS